VKNALKMSLVSALLMAQASYAQLIERREQNEDIRLRLNVQEQFRGQNTIELSGLIRSQNPNLRLRDYDVEAVILNAKSDRGRGEASLIHQGRSLGRAQVDTAASFDFESDRPLSYNQIHFRINERMELQAQGLKVELQGRIKVSSIFVILSERLVQKTARLTSLEGAFGGIQTIALKQQIVEATGERGLQAAELKEVRLRVKASVASSIELMVAGVRQDMMSVVATRDYYSSHPSTFKEIILRGADLQNVGSWVLQLRGEMKIQDVVVTYEMLREGGRNVESHPRLNGDRDEQVRRDEVIFVEQERSRLGGQSSETITRDENGRVVRRRTTTTRRL
jgi:hypothetical protein